jgi:hypothetical protein
MPPDTASTSLSCDERGTTSTSKRPGSPDRARSPKPRSDRLLGLANQAEQAAQADRQTPRAQLIQAPAAIG